MSYVKKVLVEGEQVRYVARVAWALYLPGIILCLVALLCGWYLPGLDREWIWLWKISITLEQFIPINRTAEFISYAFFIPGAIWVLKIYTIAAFTELVVTDRRVIAKVGITETQTTEIDRQKIAGVEVRQTVTGQMFNFGYVTLRGYSGWIGNLPPLQRPFEFQKAINEFMQG